MCASGLWFESGRKNSISIRIDKEMYKLLEKKRDELIAKFNKGDISLVVTSRILAEEIKTIERNKMLKKEKWEFNLF